MTEDWTRISWPSSRLGEALEVLGRHVRTEARHPEGLPSPGPAGEPLGDWIVAAAAWLDLEAEPVEAGYGEVDLLLGHTGQALLRLPGDGDPRFLALPGGRARRRPHRVAVLTPDRTRAHLAMSDVRSALRHEVEAPAIGEVERVLDRVGVRGRRRARARAAILRERLADERIGGCWLLRPAGSLGPGAPAREAGLANQLVALLAAQALEAGLWVLAWWLLGWMALQGRFEPGWLAAWLLILASIVPARTLGTLAGGRLAIRAGALLKRRLLAGALLMAPDEVRHLGAGQLLGRVLESEIVESLALSGAFLGLSALFELVLSGLVLGLGAGRLVQVFLLSVWTIIVGLLALRYSRRRRRWTDRRLVMTDDLIEQMIGHRTRVAQGGRAGRDDEDDRSLEDYFSTSRDLDRAAVRLQVLGPRGWIILGLLGLAPAFLAGGRAGADLAIGVGGVLLGYRGFRDLAEGLDHLIGATIAWDRLQMLWRAASHREPVGHPRHTAAPKSPIGTGGGRVVLEACDLSFRYPGRIEPVLRGVDLRIGIGARLLLEGSSGGGKSTLASLLAGSRLPSSGHLLLDGLDRETVGAAAWRRRVVLVPQFHENHVLVGSLAFNLLMGRGWPPRPTDWEEAERTCRALGLGRLLDRMPAGLLQPVGETGWQLSHGERSRLYIARALLQDADIIILDESFAAMDPETLRSTLAFVLEETLIVLVIAHR